MSRWYPQFLPLVTRYVIEPRVAVSITHFIRLPVLWVVWSLRPSEFFKCLHTQDMTSLLSTVSEPLGTLYAMLS